MACPVTGSADAALNASRYAGQVIGVRVVADAVRITQDGLCFVPTELATTRGMESVAQANPGG